MLRSDNELKFIQYCLNGVPMLVTSDVATTFMKHCHEVNTTLPEWCFNVGPQCWGMALPLFTQHCLNVERMTEGQ